MIVRIFVISICVVIHWGNLYGQSKVPGSSFAHTLYLGITSSPIPALNMDKVANLVEDEFTYSVFVATAINKHFAVGLEAKKIYYNIHSYKPNVNIQRQQFFQVGTFLQYGIMFRNILRASIESGLYYGDYCSCGKSFNYRSSGLFSMSLAFSIEWRIYKGLHLETGLMLQKIVNPPESLTDGFNTPLVGLTYHIKS